MTKIHHLMPIEQAREKAVELFRALALPDPDTIGDRYPHQVSGGQLQRLSAAMALIGDPKLVIFDEPTTALDVTTQVEVLRAFKSVMKKGAIAGVYVSHDLAVVAQIADRIIVLKNGEIQEVGLTQDILQRPQHPYTRELLEAFEPASRAQAADRRIEPETPLLVVKDIVAGYGKLDKAGTPVLRVTQQGQLRASSRKKSRHHRRVRVRKIYSGARDCRAFCLLRKARSFSRASNLIRICANAAAMSYARLQIVFQSADTALNPAKSIADILSRPLTFYHGMASLFCRPRCARSS